MRVLEHRNHGTCVLRERRRLQLAQRSQCLLAHKPLGVLEHRDHGVCMLSKRRRLQQAQRLQREPTNARTGVPEHSVGVLREHRRP